MKVLLKKFNYESSCCSKSFEKINVKYTNDSNQSKSISNQSPNHASLQKRHFPLKSFSRATLINEVGFSKVNANGFITRRRRIKRHLLKQRAIEKKPAGNKSNQKRFFFAALIFASQKLGQNHILHSRWSRAICEFVICVEVKLCSHRRAWSGGVRKETRKKFSILGKAPASAATSFIHATQLYLPNKSPLSIPPTYVEWNNSRKKKHFSCRF